MRDWLLRLFGRLRVQRNRLMRISGAQPLGPGAAVYAVDVDGRRILLGITARTMRVLDRYPVPQAVVEREQATSLAKDDEQADSG
jgi:flagellar biogenesis protein FliO